MANKRYVSERILKTLVIVLFIVIGASVLFIVASDGVLSQWVISPTPTSIIIKPSFGIATLVPTPTPITIIGRTTATPTATITAITRVSVDPSAIADLKNGTYTDSPLLYSVSNNSIYVIEVDTNKVIDIIHFDKNIQLYDAVVNPDYTQLYVLYYDSPKHFSTDLTNFNPDVGPYFYLATVDLKTDLIVDTTKNHGGLANGIIGMPVKMLMSKDGKYTYIALYANGVSTIYQYDVSAKTYSRYLITNKLYIFPEHSSMVADMALTPDGQYLYFTDTPHTSFVRLTVPDMSKYRDFYMDHDVYGAEPVYKGIAIDPDSQTVYVANFDYLNKSIQVITPNLLNWQDRSGFIQVSTTNKPGQVAVGPDGNRFHVLEPDAKAVETYVLDGNALWKDASYGTGNDPIDIALSPDGWSFFVLNAGDNTVTALDILNKAPFAQSPIKVGLEPRSLYMGPQPLGSVWVNTSHNTINAVHMNQIGPLPISRNFIPVKNNTTTWTGSGLYLLGNGTRIPITIINEATGAAPTTNASVTPHGTASATPANATAAPTVVVNSASPTAAASVSGGTPRPASTPGYEWIAGALSLGGAMALMRRKLS